MLPFGPSIGLIVQWQGRGVAAAPGTASLADAVGSAFIDALGTELCEHALNDAIQTEDPRTSKDRRMSLSSVKLPGKLHSPSGGEGTG